MKLLPAEGVNLAGTETGRDHLSQHRISLMLACRRKYELHAVQRLELIDRPRPLALGAAFQKAIELQDPGLGPRVLRGWEPCKKCQNGRVVNSNYQGGDLFAGDAPWRICPACEGAGGVQGLEPVIADQAAEDRLRVEEAIVESAAELYLRRWPTPLGERREVEYRVRLRNPATGRYSNTFDLLGYADGVRDQGAWLELVENKLVGQITPLSVRRLPLDRQLALERYGLWRATGKPVRRVRFRMARKPSIERKRGREDKKTGLRVGAESLDEFLDRLRGDYADPDREAFYSHEELLFTDPADMLRIEAELWEWAEQLRQARRRGFYDRNTSHCIDYGGCVFIPICTGDPDAQALYGVRPEHNSAAVAPFQEAAA